MPAPLPVCKAILLCETTIVEAGTGNVSLVNVFNGLLVNEKQQTSPFEVFCQITDAEGRYDLVVEVREVAKNEVVARAVGLAVEVLSQLHRPNVIIPVPAFQFENLGAYDLVLLANGEEIDRQQFLVTQQDGETNDDSN